MPFSRVYPLYIQKLERKGRTKQELHEVTEWLTGFNTAQLEDLVRNNVDLTEFFERATINPAASSIKGVICGVRIEEIGDPLMQKIRYLDKLVDELAKGRPMDKVLRKS